MKVLLSIKPEYANQIFDGSKRFEFRRVAFKNKSIKKVVVYATLPVGKVIGEFTVEGIIQETPAQLWERTKEHSGISEDRFSEYFRGRDSAIAIKVKKTRRYRRPLLLKDVLASGIAPQSFCYLSDESQTS